MNKSILSQAWELRAKLSETQKELSNIIVEANSGKGAVKVTINGQQIEKAENQQVAKKIISNFLGRPCHVRCIYEPEDNHLVQAAIKMGAQVTSVVEK